jgi:hypothetical protein
MTNPFYVDEESALGALDLVWGDSYDFAVVDREWLAYPKGTDETLTGSNPDELSMAVRLDWSKRNPDPLAGDVTVPPWDLGARPWRPCELSRRARARCRPGERPSPDPGDPPHRNSR